MTTAIEFDRVSKVFGSGARRVEALREVSLSVQRGQIHAVVGYSGAGKSTLLRTVNGLERPTSGRVVVEGQDITALSGKELYAARQRTGMIFQQFNLLSARTVYGNIAYPLKLAGLGQEAVLDRVEELLSFVGLTDKALAHPSQLSGGQKQRVGIARALATRPQTIIADEATSALDPATTAEVAALLRRTNEEYGVTVLLVTHEIDVVRDIAHRVTVMDAGRVVEDGTTYDVFSRPQHPVTRRFVSSVLRSVPDAGALATIRKVHRGRLVQLHVEDRETDHPFLSEVARRTGVDLNVVYGGVEELQDKLFGSLTLELLGAPGAVEAAVQQLRASTTVVDLDAGAAPAAPAARAPEEVAVRA
ncbi:methionine ABC transporter ATP-binding protein [Quadrisphaera sp. KR29]|uniref:methionine ABC transporter ATP-binding protein n=1 Tax=Quadrisphaera sp. KR29 TaxID=3461391 RepID=UPI00404406CE